MKNAEASTGNEKITEALKLLESAAKDKKADLSNLLVNKYDNLKGVMTNASEGMKDRVEMLKQRAAETATKVKEVSTEKTKEIAKNVDESVHRNPWPYIGGAAVAGLLLGYILGKKD